jgi:hypothetical protein
MNINFIYYFMNCLNIDINILEKKFKHKNYYNFNFLNIECGLNLKIFLYILNNYEEFKFKNIYNFIYNRIYKLSLIYNIDNLEKINIYDYLSHEHFDQLLSNYIDNNRFKLILILNSIQQYSYPLVNI